MRTKLLFILVMLGILAIGCSRKVAPTISLPTEQNPCDKAIKAVLDSVQSVDPVFIYDVITEAGVTDTVVRIDSTSCQQIKLMALDIVAKYNTAIKEREFYKALAQTQAKKIINNINSGNKNTQIGDANTQQIKPKATAVIGNDNVTTVKPKQSAVGDGNDLDNSKKGTSWIWVFIAGNLCWIITQNLLYPLAMRFIPFANLTSNIGKALLKLKFW